ncbi:AAA family ATPase [Azovibrio restrictus]|uniref:AAA family ATPase n=1 Tax=Azovibrio restrictus TaxID=146938 RepID=UPI0026E93DC6|nr:AAA family ATPase [Azovibrio restrictus]MDD3483662.1 AAA family ATPase [Azovibrio restrictus]
MQNQYPDTGKHEGRKLWLSFFGSGTLIQPGSRQRINMRYRKSQALLAFLSSQPNRPQRREMVAELFWPGRPQEESKRNLRVVLNDLGRVAAGLGLAPALEIDRQWLLFRSLPQIRTDESLLQELLDDSPQAAAFHAALTQAADTVWGEALEVDEDNPDWNDWLYARRSYLETLLAQALRSARSPAPAQSACTAAPELAHLALLRLETGLPQRPDHEDLPAYLAWRETLARMTGEGRFFGGESTGGDATGLTFVFGLNSLNSGFRWQALRAAAALDARFSRHPGLRMGLSAGACIIERQPDGTVTLSGWRSKWVERIADQAAPGALVADAGFADLAPLFGLAPVPPSPGPLPGEPLFMQHLQGFRLPELPPLDCHTPLVGRQSEMEYLERLWQESRQGLSRRATLVAVPGMGKTRLVWEFARHCLARGARLAWFGARAETASQPWSLIYEWLSRAFADLPRHRLEAHQETLLGQFLERRNIPMAERGEFERILARLLGHYELVILDDAHWMDGASAQLLRRALEQQTRQLTLVTRRRQSEPAALLADSYVLELPPLDDTAAAQLLDNMAPEGPPVPARQRRAAVHQARGIPIYLLAPPGLHSDGNPEREFLAATLNAVRPVLPTLGAAALLGMQWQRSELQALVGQDAALQAIHQGQAAHVLLSYDAEHWAFVHPLIHEALRRSLPESSRQELAGSAARHFQEQGEAGRAATMWEEAGQLDQAREAWRSAARAASAAEDVLAACTHYAQLERLGYGSSSTALWDRIYHARALVIHDGFGTAATLAHCHQVLELLPARKNGEQQEIEFAALTLIYLWAGGSGKHQGLAQADRLMGLADRPLRRFTADWAFGNTHFWLGNFAAARPYLETVLTAALDLEPAERTRYSPSDPHSLAAPCHAWLLWFIGDAAWSDWLERHLALARAAGVRQSLCSGLALAALIQLAAGNHGQCARMAREAADIATAEGFAFWEVITGLVQTIVAARAGQKPDLDNLLTWEETIRKTYGAGINSARWLAAEALVAAGQWQQAGAWIERALAQADSCEHAYCLPDLWRLQGQILEAGGDPAGAEAARQQAQTQAEAMGARGWLARHAPELAATPLEYAP